MQIPGDTVKKTSHSILTSFDDYRSSLSSGSLSQIYKGCYCFSCLKQKPPDHFPLFKNISFLCLKTKLKKKTFHFDYSQTISSHPFSLESIPVRVCPLLCRYADDNTLMAESEEELNKQPLDESEKE